MQLITSEIVGENICVLTFDRPDSSANVFDRATLSELNQQIDFIAGNAQIAGVIFFSAKKSIFIAGADLHSMHTMSREELDGMISLGQSVFARIASLKVPTVAAIHGACVGGGYEVALACRWRVASADRVTKIGLPEVSLGLIPAWGGSTRLPRLIGLPNALDVILNGKVLSARSALRRGMIDEIAPREYLLKAAVRSIRERRTHRAKLTHGHLANKAAALIAGPRARKLILKRTRGHYPAPMEALRVVLAGLGVKESASLANEREAMLRLSETDVTANLLRLFLMQERAKKRAFGDAPKTKDRPGKMERVAVIGSGVMGSGIAQWLSARGLNVLLRDINPDAVAKGMGNISRLYSEGAKRGVFTKVEARDGLDRVTPSSMEVPLKNVDLVIEAAVEKMDLKKKIFARLDEVAGPGTILATNTSALSISDLATATKNPARVVGIHFFNPVHKMQLVEVVVGRETGNDAASTAMRFAQQIGRLPVPVRDSPGFLVNRILLPYMVEAGRCFEACASVEEIDGAMLDFGMPMGPLRLIDEVGVDISADVAGELASAFSNRMSVPPVLTRMIEAGMLGKKSGRGFYVHVRGHEARVNADALKFQRTQGAKTWSREELQWRMVLLMINEAARCLEEKVVFGGPEDVDFAMVMGTGWAPFRGGPLRYADTLGAAKIVEELSRFAATDPHYEPCTLLRSMAKNGGRFYES